MRAWRKLLTPGKTRLGTFCALGSVEAVELACHAGFDFVIVDGQHGVFDLAGLHTALRAIDATACFPIVRLPAHGLMQVESLLDCGYPAVLAPMVNTAAQARELVAACCYPPTGQRSQSGCRASLREGPAYRESFNRDFALIVMIEHLSAVDEVERILAVPGVAACFVGPSDLASSMEASPAGGGAAAFAAVVERVRAACAKAGTPVGIAAPTLEEARRYAQQGFSFVTLGTDRRLLGSAMEKTMAAWRLEP